MMIERIYAGEWGWVREWLVSHLLEIGGGLEERDVRKFKPLLKDPSNWFVRAENGGVMGLFVFLKTAGGPRVFEVHASGSETGWRWIGLARRVRRWFVQRSGATRLESWTRQENERSGVFIRASGLKPAGKFAQWLGRLGWVWSNRFEWKESEA